MATLYEQLIESIRHLVLENLPFDRNSPKVSHALAAKTPRQLLILWFNWNQRMIPINYRQVLISKEFLANPTLKNRQVDIYLLLLDIQLGNDLSKYLSRRVETGFEVRSDRKLQRRKDLDLMLNAWGIHHLHFSSIVDPDGFVDRTDFDEPIIFAAFRHDVAFLIDIMRHGDWNRKHVLEILARNWPNHGLVHKIPRAHSLAMKLSDEDRKTLRSKGVNTAVEIDGEIYVPNGLMSGSGFSIHVVRQADQVMIAINEFAQRYDRNPENVISKATMTGASWPAEPKFIVEFRPDAFGVTELHTQIFWKLG